MQAAQRLFQDGHISYHRTDSTTLSEKALAESARAIREMFGDEYYDGAAPLRDEGEERAGSARGDPADEFRRARRRRSKARSIGDDLRVYELIWKRTMASQMVDARVLRTTVEISGAGDERRAGGVHRVGQGDRVRRLPPRLRRRQRRSGGGARGAGDRAAEARPSASASTRDRRARVHAVALEPKRHETTPPARYTEASLIKELERLGIGRPSTYAATIGTIERRGYVFRQGKALVPSFTAFAVTRLLRDAFRRSRRRRVHRGDGRGPRPDLARRARVARLHPAVLSRRHASSRPRRSGQAGGGDAPTIR